MTGDSGQKKTARSKAGPKNLETHLPKVPKFNSSNRVFPKIGVPPNHPFEYGFPL